MSLRLEVVEIATGEVVHTVPCSGETPGTHAMDRLLRGVLNNVGRFDVRLTRGGDDGEDNRLDTDRYFVRQAGGRA